MATNAGASSTGDKLDRMVGCWQVKRFVKPNNVEVPAYAKKQPPKKIRKILKRNELLYLLNTPSKHVLHGRYVNDGTKFWIFRRATDSKILNVGTKLKILAHMNCTAPRRLTADTTTIFLCGYRRGTDGWKYLTPFNGLATSTTSLITLQQ